MADIDKIKVGNTTYNLQSSPLIYQNIMTTQTDTYNSGTRYSPVYTYLSYDEESLPGTLLIINEAKIRLNSTTINSGGFLEGGLFSSWYSTSPQSYLLGVTSINPAGTLDSMYLNGTTVVNGSTSSPNYYRPFCSIIGSSYRVAKFTNTTIVFGSSYGHQWASSVLTW